MAAFLNLVIILSVVSTGNSLSLNHYENSCPKVECIVAKAVKDATAKDKTVPAALLRMHFHDCFVRVTEFWLSPFLLTVCFGFIWCVIKQIIFSYLFPCFLEGVWCLRAAKFKRKQQSRKRWATKRFFACILCHRCSKESIRSCMPWCGLLCWYPSSSSKGRSFSGK